MELVEYNELIEQLAVDEAYSSRSESVLPWAVQ